MFIMMFNFIKNLSIKWKILSSAFIIFFFTIFISDGIFLLTIYKTLYYRNSFKNERLAEVIASSLKYPLYTKKAEFIKNYLSDIIKHRKIEGKIEGLILYDAKGDYVISSGNYFSGNKFDSHDNNNADKRGSGLLLKHLNYNGKNLGTLAVKFNLKKELNGVKVRVFWVGIRFLVIAAGFIAIGLFMFYMITVFLTKPLSEIKKNIEEIKSGNYKINFRSKFNDEIGSVINAINSMAYAIEDYMKRIDSINKEKNELNCMAIMGEMSANIAHEIKNAIYIISSANNYIAHETKNKIVEEFAGIINNEVNRLNRMTIDFLSFSRQRSPELTPLDINKLINDSLSISKFELSNFNIKLIKDLGSNIPIINGDPELLKQVILNLIVNAIDATCAANSSAAVEFKNKVIKIRTMVKNGYLNIHIENNGQPIAKENMENIFKPFFTTKNAGSGLGLPMSLRIIKLHGGTIDVQSDKKRTVFNVIIPILRQSEQLS